MMDSIGKPGIGPPEDALSVTVITCPLVVMVIVCALVTPFLLSVAA